MALVCLVVALILSGLTLTDLNKIEEKNEVEQKVVTANKVVVGFLTSALGLLLISMLFGIRSMGWQLLCTSIASVTILAILIIAGSKITNMLLFAMMLSTGAFNYLIKY
jgi:hypothetical protein